MADLVFCSHYPFTPGAREVVRSSGQGITPNSVALGEGRIASSLRDGSIPPRATDLEEDLKEEILAYAASRAIIAFMKNRIVASRMAVAEAKRASAYLRGAKDGAKGYAEALSVELGLHFTPAGDGFTVPVWEYLQYTPRSIDYKLSNKEVSGGLVRVSAHQRIRILEEAARKKVEAAPLPNLKEWPTEVKEAASRLVKLLPMDEIAPTSIATADFPPCIRKMIEDLRTATNVPHTGRVALAIYLVKAGLPDEQIVKIFQNAPDFSAETTAYQVKYIRNKGYSMPSCATMDTWGICIAECRCGSPTNFRKSTHGANAERSMVKHDE